jgi:hypothetical protein
MAKFKQQKKAHFEAKAGPGKKSLAFLLLFEEINTLKKHLEPKIFQAVRRGRNKAESILSTVY